MPSPKAQEKLLLLIDANSLIHRAFHALPPFTNADGQPTGALYGLASILLKIIREDSPDYIAAFFDRPEPTFRKEIFKEYKIHRPKAPDSLVSQIVEAHGLFEKFDIKYFEAPGFEADDLIGTAALKFKSTPNLKSVILSGDLDSLQLVKNEKILVKTLKKGVSETLLYNEAAVKERFGVSPEQLSDYKGLVGDTSDNIPGVSGIGPKTAAALIQKYGRLENILEKGREEKSYSKITEAKEQIFLSRRLASLNTDSPVRLESLEELEYDGWSEKKLIPYFEKLGFQSLIKRIKTESPSEPPPQDVQKKLF